MKNPVMFFKQNVISFHPSADNLQDWAMGQEKTIFVVDDDDTIRSNLQKYLGRQGFAVESMSNGFEVLTMCMYIVPELIISDIRMPRMNGISLLKALRSREETKHIPVIFMTAFPKDEIIEEAKMLGAKYFLIKPFPFEYLDELLKRVVPHLVEKKEQNTEN